jgi:hypothetical protein
VRTEVSQDWFVERLVENAERAMQVRAVTDAMGKPNSWITREG